MADSGIRERTQRDRPAAVYTPLPDDVLLLKRFTGTERLGQLYEYELELVSEKPEQVDFDKLLGAPMSVRLALPDGAPPRAFHGLVSRFSQVVGGTSELTTYRATMVPWTWMMSRKADCRIFHDPSASELTVPKIVLQMFRDFGASGFRDELAGTYSPLEYCVQYRETSLAFVNRLMEREGIYYFFEHKEDSYSLVLADSASAHKPYPGYETLIYRGREEVHPDEEHVSHWELRRQVQPGAVALGGFDFKQPGNDLNVRSAASLTHAESKHEVYDYPGLYTKRDAGEQYARVRLEELQAEHEVVMGDAAVGGVGYRARRWRRW